MCSEWILSQVGMDGRSEDNLPCAWPFWSVNLGVHKLTIPSAVAPCQLDIHVHQHEIAWGVHTVCRISCHAKFNNLKLQQNPANLERFRTSNFKIFFNHGEIIIIRKYKNQINLERFRPSNFKIFFNHGEIMIVRKYQNQVNLESFGTSNFNIFFNHGEGIFMRKYQNQINFERLWASVCTMCPLQTGFWERKLKLHADFLFPDVNCEFL